MTKIIISRHAAKRLKARVYVSGKNRQKSYAHNAYINGLRPEELPEDNIKEWVMSLIRKIIPGKIKVNRKDKKYYSDHPSMRHQNIYEYVLYKNVLLVYQQMGYKKYLLITVMNVPADINGNNQQDEYCLN